MTVQFPKFVTTFKPWYINTKKIKYIKSVSVAPPDYTNYIDKSRLNFDLKYMKVVQCSISIENSENEYHENEISLVVYGNVENIPDYVMNNFQEVIADSSYYNSYEGKKIILKSILSIYNCNTVTPCYTYSMVPDFKPIEVNREYFISSEN